MRFIVGDVMTNKSPSVYVVVQIHGEGTPEVPVKDLQRRFFEILKSLFSLLGSYNLSIYSIHANMMAYCTFAADTPMSWC